MYRVELTYDNTIIAAAECPMFSDAADLAIEDMPAMFLAVPKDVSLRVSKNGEFLFCVPLSVHLAAMDRVEMVA